MFLIVGLGNPGKEYVKTRHNAGFMAIDELAESWEKNPSWSEELYRAKKHEAELLEFEIFFKDGDHHHVALAKPQTMMNNSGLSVKKLLKACNAKPEELIVVHDDIDLPVGQMKISFDASAGGHNGVKSIIAQIKTKEFYRIRIGIKPEIKRSATEQLVLEKFTTDEASHLKKILIQMPEIVKTIIEDGMSKAMTLYNKKPTA